MASWSISTGADALSAEELAGALIVVGESNDAGKREEWAKRGAAFFQGRSRRVHQRLTATRAALRRNRAARNRRQAARARHDMRAWQVERRGRTRHLIELGGLVVKAGIIDLTGDDRAIIYGALLWVADKLQSDQGEHVRAVWSAKGKQAFEDAGPVGLPSGGPKVWDHLSANETLISDGRTFSGT